MRVHVFRGVKLGWESESEGIWFDASLYTKEQAEAQFVEKYGTTTKANGQTYDYTYYEYDGVKYYKVSYLGEFDYENMPYIY